MRRRRLAVVGTGLIGASVGLAARPAFEVTGYDADASAAREALAAGALDSAAASLDEALAGAEVVVLATPVAATVALLEALRPLPEATLVTDTASVKGPVAAAGRGVPAFVAGHPIAGSERSGPSAARAGLFRGRAWALVPSGDRALDGRAEEFVRSLGAQPFAVTADEHDAAIALTSHLPQVLSTALGAALAQRLGEPAVAGLCGPGIASLLRLADSPWGVWAAILDANAAAVAQEVRAFAAILRTVADEVEAHDAGALAARFAAAGSVRARLGTNDVAAGSVTRDTPSF